MLWFKSCPRCSTGDLTIHIDQFGWYIHCLQCGYMKDLDDPRTAAEVVRSIRATTLAAAEAAEVEAAAA